MQDLTFSYVNVVGVFNIWTHFSIFNIKHHLHVDVTKKQFYVGSKCKWWTEVMRLDTNIWLIHSLLKFTQTHFPSTHMLLSFSMWQFTIIQYISVRRFWI